MTLSPFYFYYFSENRRTNINTNPKKGVITCPGIFPTAFAILWRRQSKAAAIIAPILGMATGFAVWLGSAYAFSGEVTVASTGKILPCVYGTVASGLSPIPYSLIITLFKPQDFSWEDFRKEKLAFDKLDPLEPEPSSLDDSGKISNQETANATEPPSPQTLKRWGRIAVFWSLATFLGHWVLWPLPMYASHYVFNRSVRFFFSPLSPSPHSPPPHPSLTNANTHSSSQPGSSSP